MKRPLAVSGLVYLTVLTVVFYFRTPAVMLAVTAAATLMVCAVLVLRHFKPLPVAALVTAGVSALLAVLSIFLNQNFTVQPLLDRYIGKAVRVEGYLGDLVTENKRGKTYIIHTETIDGAPCSTKISYTVFSKKDWEPFDKLCVTVTPKASTYSYSLSRGIYLRAAESKKADLVMTGEKHRSFYASAVALRLEMQKILDNHLDDNAQSLASAVLLGEKNALEPDVRDAFSDTGMSYLVVVSGMHLAIITMLLKKLLKPRFGAKGILRMILITAFVLLFAAVTGFTPSVVRAAVMMLFIVAAPLFRRESDSVNALGAAALVLTLPNPYVVGNVGLLLSFAATLGILLWADAAAQGKDPGRQGSGLMQTSRRVADRLVCGLALRNTLDDPACHGIFWQDHACHGADLVCRLSAHLFAAVAFAVVGADSVESDRACARAAYQRDRTAAHRRGTAQHRAALYLRQDRQPLLVCLDDRHGFAGSYRRHHPRQEKLYHLFCCGLCFDAVHRRFADGSAMLGLIK